MRRGLLLSLPAVLLAIGSAGAIGAAPAEQACSFVLGFGELHARLGGVDGACIDNEHDNPNGTGDRVQGTLNPATRVQGDMVWQKATNTMRWTDGFRTFTYSSCGLQERLNTQAWLWKANPQVISGGVVPPAYCDLAPAGTVVRAPSAPPAAPPSSPPPSPPRATATPRPAPTPTSAPAPSTAPASSNCDPSYPGVCIPPPPPDLECPEIPHRNFTVLPPDPHRFDADKDGIGCET